MGEAKQGHETRRLKVIFLDECYIYLGDKQGRTFVTQGVDEVLLDECLVLTFKQSSVRVMVWGCIIEGHRGPLVVLEYLGGKGGGMNSMRYQDQVLNPVLKPFYMKMNHERQTVYFQQDGAASHRSKSTMQWFTKNQISLIDHPPSSPDLNPIEPVWLDLKNIFRHLTHPPSTITELKTVVLDAWEQLSLEQIDGHILFFFFFFFFKSSL